MKNGVSSTCTDTTYLYMNRVIVARLPTKCSRHNTTSRSHAVTKLIKSNCFSSSSFNQGENKTEKTENLLVSINSNVNLFLDCALTFTIRQKFLRSSIDQYFLHFRLFVITQMSMRLDVPLPVHFRCTVAKRLQNLFIPWIQVKLLQNQHLKSI